MNNTDILNNINNKLLLSDVSLGLGAGIKMYQLNNSPVAEIHTGFATLNTTGAKYITSNNSPAITIGNFKMFNNAINWQVYITDNLGNPFQYNMSVRITGVDSNNNEATEDISIYIIGSTNNLYKMVNDITIINATLANLIIYCFPTNQPSNEITLVFTNSYKINPFFMCSNKNGMPRKARLRGINYLYNTVANTNISLHVFQNNNIQAGSTNLGVWSTPFRMYDVKFDTASTVTNCITFPDDGIVELEPGELAVFYREGATTSTTKISFTWSFYYTS